MKKQQLFLKKLNWNSFCPKQMTGANGVIPIRYIKEMKKILENAEKHLDFLKETDDSGYTVSKESLMLFPEIFLIMVGPVGNGSKTGWAVRREQGQVLPWNMEQKIDMRCDIRTFYYTNLIRECTYLPEKKYCQSNPLLYEAYCVLNEINNLRINGKRIVLEVKQDIYKELFQGVRLGKKVTRKTLCSYLMNEEF
ncbi:MAG: CRISPR-associated endonuclease Cas9 REC1/REC2 domain-containing protein [Blautia faecis]